MARTADVVIIGGGIHGCSTALHLALRGLKPILIEKDYAGRHASGVNAGGVRQLARDIHEIPLSISSMDIWERIEELVGDDCGFDAHGTVLVAESESELAGFRERVDDLNLRGFGHEELIDGAVIESVLRVLLTLGLAVIGVHTINVYRADTNALVLTQASSGTTNGTFEYWNGSAWVAGLGSDTVGTRRRFVPSASLPSGIDLYAQLIVA